MRNDLISKSALLKELEEKVYPEKYGEKCNAIDVINGVLQVIGELPTAYDVDKVAKRLEEMRDTITNNISLNSQGEDVDEEILNEISHYQKIIKIVKSGGIE